ncbi:MAG: helix-turn-helix domain-containing protein, partial [Candidatus Ancillula sp.]|nr:helix-turn-helix domain-containing protein [Candidatus Ancillula sp.]
MNKYTNSYDSTKPYTRLTEQEREYIAQELLNKKSIREIATRLGRSPSTISRE